MEGPKHVQGLTSKIISHFQDPSGRGWRPNLSQFIRFHWAWTLAELRGMRLHDFWSEGLRTAENACRVHSLAPRIALILGASAAFLASRGTVDWVWPAMPMMSGLCWTPCKCSEPSWLASLPFLLDSFSSPLTCVTTWQISVSKAEWSLAAAWLRLPSNLCLFTFYLVCITV